MRECEVDHGSYGNDAGGIDDAMTLVVVPLDVPRIDRGGEWIGKAHTADQLTYLQRHGRPSPTRFRLPAPVRSEPHTMPTYDGVRFNDRQRRSNIGEQPTEADGNQSIGSLEGRPLWPHSPQNIDLLAQHQVLSGRWRGGNSWKLAIWRATIA